MTHIIKFFYSFFKQPEQYFFFKLPSRDKKKIVLRAVEESNKMQSALLEKYSKEFPKERQQFYTN